MDKKQLQAQYRSVYMSALERKFIAVPRKNVHGKLITPYKRKGIRQAIRQFLKQNPENQN